MKRILLLGTLLLNLANASECLLDKPVDLPESSLVKNELIFRDVTVDNVPQSMRNEKYNAQSDYLTLYIKEIIYNDQNTGALGAIIKLNSGPVTVGSFLEIVGESQIIQSKEKVDGVTTYFSKDVMKMGENELAVSTTTIKTKLNQIISVSLKYPVFREIGANMVSFTGKHHEVCVKSMRHDY